MLTCALLVNGGSIMEVYGVVYLIVNMVNGKRYVGQAIQPLAKRFNAHAYADSLIGKAIRKYGKENFHCGVKLQSPLRLQLDGRRRRRQTLR